MDKFTGGSTSAINRHDVYLNGALYCEILCERFKKTANIVAALNLQAEQGDTAYEDKKARELCRSLTPPEGIVAGEKDIIARECKSGEWYCTCFYREWFKACAATSANTRNFKRLWRGDIDIQVFDNYAYLYPAVTLDTRVDKLDIGDKCTVPEIVKSVTWTRVSEFDDALNYYMVSDDCVLRPFTGDQKVRRVPEDKP